MTDQRTLYEAAVVDRLKESGFLEIQIRVECLMRCDDGYQDEVIHAGWHYWKAAIAAHPPAENLRGFEAALIEAEDMLDGLFRGEAHKDGCLWKNDSRMPCQCGAADRYWILKRRVDAILKARDTRLTAPATEGE